jgi:hypothetical protein
LRWVRDKAVKTDTIDKLAIVVTDGIFNKARAQAELNHLAEAGLDSVCKINSRMIKIKYYRVSTLITK